MRVLMISTEKLPVPPIRGGAVQTYIDAVVPGLAAHHDLTVLGVDDPSLPEVEARNGATYVRIPGGDLEVYAAGVADYLRDRPYDIVHIYNRPKLVRTVRQHAPGARIVLSLHNDMFEPHKIDPADGEAVIHQVDTVMTVSDYVGRRVAHLYPAVVPKLRTVYSAVDLDRFRPRWTEEAGRIRQQLREEHKLGGSPVVLYVGRLSPKKGVDILIRAMPSVVRAHPGTALVLVGSKWYGGDQEGEYVAYVRALAARSPARVLTSGFVPPDEVHHWFWLGDVFVCPSQWEEPLARVHYEAMAAGLPIVTTERGGNPEVVAGYGNGVVVEQSEDPQAFARVLTDLLRDPARRDEMGRRGRELVEHRFSWDRLVEEIRAVWGAPRTGDAWRPPAEQPLEIVQETGRSEALPEAEPDPSRAKAWEKELERLRARAKQEEQERAKQQEARAKQRERLKAEAARYRKRQTPDKKKRKKVEKEKRKQQKAPTGQRLAGRAIGSGAIVRPRRSRAGRRRRLLGR
jgi:spore coat protein SA